MLRLHFLPGYFYGGSSNRQSIGFGSRRLQVQVLFAIQKSAAAWKIADT